MKPELFGQKPAPIPISCNFFQGSHRALYGWVFGLVLGWAWSAVVVAAPPSHPETAAEIERALSVPTAQPPLQLRGAPSPGSPGAVRLRGLGEIVSDPAPPSSQRTDPAAAPPPRTPAPVAPTSHQIADPVASPPPRTIGPAETVNYPTLIQNRPKVAALIHFDVNSARIRGDAYKLLNEYVKALNSAALADAVLVIAGHTDSTGSREYNLRLSRERARAVRDYLIARGIAPDRLIARGYGPDHPVASNATVAGRDLNRRSEFIRVDVSTTANP